MIKLFLLLIFANFSFANNFIPLLPSYNVESKKLKFRLDINNEIIFENVEFSSTTREKPFLYTKYTIKTSDPKCQEFFFRHRKAFKEDSYFHNTYPEIILRKNSLCSQENLNGINFLDCSKGDKDIDDKDYAITYDNNEVEPTESIGISVQKECYNKLKDLMR